MKTYRMRTCALTATLLSAAACAETPQRPVAHGTSVVVAAPAPSRAAPSTAPQLSERAESPAAIAASSAYAYQPLLHDDLEEQVRQLRGAQALYRQFIDKAGDDPAMRLAVERSRTRIEDIDAICDFLEQQHAQR